MGAYAYDEVSAAAGGIDLLLLKRTMQEGSCLIAHFRKILVVLTSFWSLTLTLIVMLVPKDSWRQGLRRSGGITAGAKIMLVIESSC